MRRAREKVTGKLLALDRSLEPFLPALWSLLDVATRIALGRRSIRRSPAADARGDQAGLLSESRVQPLLVVFEDLPHWVESESPAFLDGLMDSTSDCPRCLLVNFVRVPAPWSRKTYFREIRLDPLPPDTTDGFSTRCSATPACGVKRLLVAAPKGCPLSSRRASASWWR